MLRGYRFRLRQELCLTRLVMDFLFPKDRQFVALVKLWVAVICTRFNCSLSGSLIFVIATAKVGFLEYGMNEYTALKSF